MPEKDPLTQDQIISLDDSFHKTYEPWHTRQEKDFEMWYQKPYSKDAWSENITFNESRIFADSVFQILEASKVHVKCHIKNEPRKEAKVEKFCYSALNDADLRLQNQQSPSGKSQEVWFSGIRGVCAGRWLLYQDKNDKNKLIADHTPYDGRWTSWESDGAGLIWSGFTTFKAVSDLERVFNKEFSFLHDKEKTIKVAKCIEFWDRNYEYVVVLQDGVVDNPLGEYARDPKPHGFGKPPVVITPVGTMPVIFGSTGKFENIINWADSIFAGSRNLIPVLNSLLTTWMNLVVKSDHQGGFVTAKMEGGKIDSPYGKDDWTLLPEGANVIPLKPSDIANSLPQLVDFISQAIQRSDFVWLKYGQLWKGQELSRVAITELTEGANKILIPLLTALGRYYASGLRLWIDQFRMPDKKPHWYKNAEWFARGKDYEGNIFQENITKSDIVPGCDLEVEFVSNTPEEEAESYAKAEVAAKAGASKKFVREQLYDDPKGIEDESRIEEMEEVVPTIKLWKAFQSMLAKGADVEAKLLFRYMFRIFKVEGMDIPEDKLNGEYKALLVELKKAEEAKAQTGPQPITVPQGGGRPPGPQGQPIPMGGM